MTDWKARAEREAAAVISGATGTMSTYTYRDVIALCAVAWLQGNIAGTHETLSDAEQAFEQIRAAL